ncbi:MAG TPA: methyltransferase domain-containing protein [Thermoleophilaceae bacterium]|nr:methyltransferase domain-containing protein [Thermoleophilaceae bacterium]
MATERLTNRLAALGMIRSPEQYRLRPDGPGAVLDVGCGRAKHPGATGIDISPDTDADLVLDLDRTPYPLGDGSFDQILCQDVLEHVQRPLEVLAELHRIGRSGARIHLRTPHYSSVLAYGDPTHVRAFSAMTIRSLEEPLFEHYTKARFRVIDVTLDFWDPLRWIGVARLANRFQSTYEMLFAFRFPAMNIRATLEILK